MARRCRNLVKRKMTEEEKRLYGPPATPEEQVRNEIQEMAWLRWERERGKEDLTDEEVSS